ncbi:MAG: DUF2490 domain-containing protein, partial [Bacteroidia bacterium]
MKKGISLIFAIICLSIVGKAQLSKTIIPQNQVWLSINSSNRFSEHFGLIADFHTRRNNFLQDDNFYFARLGGAYWVNSQLTIVAGAAHLWLAQELPNAQKAFQNENRIYQQLQWRQNVGRATLVQRIRNEQRWHKLLNGNGDYYRTRFSNRIRFLSSVTFKLFTNPKLPQFNISDEVHIHFGKDIVFNTFDQNRVFAGFKIPLTSHLKFDIGYMLVYQ